MAEEERILEVTPDFDGKRIDQVKRLISPELIVRESTAGKNLSTETKK